MRTLLLTGANRGIGKAIASEFAAANWQILSPSRAELNLADPTSIRAFSETLRDARVDALVNNAGINHLNSVADIDDADWQEMLQVNLTAARQLTQAVLPGMRARGWGRIVNLSSILGQVARPKRTAYSVTKAGLNALTRSVAVEVAADGILINAVCPGYIETDLTHQNNSSEQLAEIIREIPAGRLGTPTEIAKIVYFLSSEANTYLTGQTLVVDGGFTSQ